MRRSPFPRRFQPGLDLLEGRLTPTTIYFVTSAADTEDVGTLRKAILLANDNPGEDRIGFNIPGDFVQTIQVGSNGLGDLPPITDAVTINGYSQRGSDENSAAYGFNGKLRVELNGEAVGPSNGGLQILTAKVRIEGLVINRFNSPGIVIRNGGCAIMGNVIGANADGTLALPNAGPGILIEDVPAGADANEIGGSLVSYRNLISANAADGIRTVSNTHIENNLIGVDATGTLALPNGGAGVFVTGYNNEIKSNVIGANGTNASLAYPHGIVLTQRHGFDPAATYDAGVGFNHVDYNKIGVNGDGVSSLGNVADGVFVELSINNRIFGNRIANNGRNGVTIAGDERTVGNAVSENRFSLNAGLGIDLGADGPTLNDADDADDGANHLMSYPVIDRVVYANGTIKAYFHLSSALGNTAYPIDVEFYHADASGQGDEWFKTIRGISHSNNEWTFEHRPAPGHFDVGDFLTATARDYGVAFNSGNSSEFAPPVQSAGGEIIVDATAGPLAGLALLTNERGGSAGFTVVLGSKPAYDVIIPVRSSAIGEGTVSPAFLTFKPGNFDQHQTVTITGVDDAGPDGDVPYLIQFDPAISADGYYSGLDSADIEVKNLDDESGDTRVFINPPASIIPGERFTYEVVVVNLGASGHFSVSSYMYTTPYDLAEIDSVAEAGRARRRGRHRRAAPVGFELESGASKTVNIRGHAKVGSGGAAIHLHATATADGRDPFTATSDDTVSAQPLGLILEAPKEVKELGGGSFGSRFHYTITIHNSNAVAATGVELKLGFTTSERPLFTGGSVSRPSASYAIDRSDPTAALTFNLGDIAPGETVIIRLTAHGYEPNTYYSQATLTGSLGTPFTLFSPTVSTKFTKGAVEYLFLAGLAVLAGQEYLDRRRRRKPRQDQIAEQETTDEVFEELTHTRDKTA